MRRLFVITSQDKHPRVRFFFALASALKERPHEKRRAFPVASHRAASSSSRAKTNAPRLLFFFALVSVSEELLTQQGVAA